MSELYIPPHVQHEINKSQATSGVVADADLLWQLSNQFLEQGDRHTAGKLVERAMSLDGTGKTAVLDVPGLGSQSSTFDGRVPFFNAVGDDLMKGIVKNAYSPSPTPYRINETLLWMGAYHGISDPADASNVTFRYLAAISKSPFVEPIIRMLENKARRHAKVPRHLRDKGFEIRMKNKRQSPSRAAQRRIEELTQFMLHGGFYLQPDGSPRKHRITEEPGVWDGNYQEKAMSFSDTLATLTRYSWTFDWAPYRMEPAADPDAYPVVFFTPVDADKVLLTKENYEPKIGPRNYRRPIKFIEMGPDYNPLCPVREYAWDRMTSIVRRPRLDFFGKGYGLSETEIAIEIIASMILGLDFQKSYFDKNHVPPGILQVIGNTRELGRGTIADLKAQMAHSGGGPNAFWKMMVLAFNPGQGTGLQFLPLRQQMGGTGEMQFVIQWFSFLIAILCSIFQVNAEEINFPGFSNQTSSIGGEGDPTAKLEHSEEKSHKPSMDAIAASFNQNLIERIDPDFELCWVGLDEHPEKAQLEADKMRLDMGIPLNRVLARNDEPELKIPLRKDLRREIEQKHSDSDKFDSEAEREAQIDAEYEKAFRKLVPDETVSPWSMIPDLPLQQVGSQFLAMELQSVQQAIQQGQQEKLMKENGYSDEEIAQTKLGLGGQDQQGRDPNGQDPNAQGEEEDGDDQPQDPFGDGQERYDPRDPFGHNAAKGDDDERDEYDEDEDSDTKSGPKGNFGRPNGSSNNKKVEKKRTVVQKSLAERAKVRHSVNNAGNFAPQSASTPVNPAPRIIEVFVQRQKP